MRKNFIIGGIVVRCLLWASPGEGAQLNWQVQEKVKWAELKPPKDGKTGFVPMSFEQTGINFTNVLDEWSSAANRVLENGGGAAVGDFDGDDRPDIFLCSLKGRNMLYRNLGAWRFEEVTLSAGVNATNYVCRGAVFADINGDGRLDLLISTLGHGVLCFRNDGKGGFADVTQRAGTESKFGSTTLALADIDGNGTLDLYVTNYRTDDIRDHVRIDVQRSEGRVTVAPWLRDRLILTEQGLLEFGEPDILYLNDGKGHFSPVSWTGGKFLDESGKPLAAQPLDWGLAATFRDINGDEFPDIYVCNDYWTPDRIWINDGKGGFRPGERVAIRHTSENSMGVDFADIDRDGHEDFLVLDMLSRNSILRKRQALAQTKMTGTIGEISNRPQIMRNTLFHNRGDGTFEEIAHFCGVSASEWSWQPVFIDVDLDGYEDVIIPAGHTRDIQDLDATERITSLQHPWPKNVDPKIQQEIFTREMMEHARLYPKLQMPIVAFRNLGNLRFEDVTQDWGTSAPGVHQGIACGDIDGDGDLDLVVNNLNGVAGVYRNEGSAPRVAVRLKGQAPNTRGIGAKIGVYGGAVPMQSQEMICGGRYLSSDDPMRVFAAGSMSNEMRIEVKWRSGKWSVVNGVKGNRIYEIDEAGAEAINPQPSTVNPVKPLFEDVSGLLNHRHHEEEFNDYGRQGLLPRKLSQLGPGVGWYDVDGDGWEDLIIGSGKGGKLAVYQNNGKGGFGRLQEPPFNQSVTRDQTSVLGWVHAGRRIILTGSANYEDGLALGTSVRQYEVNGGKTDDTLPGQESSTGPLALADYDGDGDLDLFVGGRVMPGRYPEAASSRLFRNEEGKLVLDAENTKALERVGLVSGAVFSDLDGDGKPELVLACEWGPLRVFKNERDKLTPWDVPVTINDQPRKGVRPSRDFVPSTLSQLTGWWNGVTTGDFDNDGRLDIVASNWGRNTKYETHLQEPLTIYYGDFNGDGTVQALEGHYAPELKKVVPRQGLNAVGQAMPWVREKYGTHAAYTLAGMEEILGDRRKQARQWTATTLESMILLHRGDHFEANALPVEAQLAPSFGVSVGDFDGDGSEDIFLSQNFFAARLEDGRYDAGRGLWLRGDGKGNFEAVPGKHSGVRVYGEQRGSALCDYDGDGRMDLVVTQNGAETKLYRNTGAKPGMRVRLKGPAGNPTGIGAVLRLKFQGGFGPVREVHAGSGYWSQDSTVPILATPALPPNEVEVGWPGGKITSSQIPQGVREVSVDTSGRMEKLR